MKNNWQPPFILYAAGFGSVSSSSYRNDVSRQGGPSRLLIKHTLSGTGTLYVKKKRMLVKPGMIFVIERPGPYIYCYEEEAEPWKFEFLSISFTNPEGLLPKGFLDHPLFSLEEHPELKSEFQELVRLRAAEDYRYDLLHSAKAYHFFLSYLNVRMKKSSAPPYPVQRLKKILDAGFAERISIAESSRKTGYSHEALTRLFSSTYGVSPERYLLNKRLRHARGLLRGGRLSIKEVALKSGFSSQNYFSRVFRQKSGINPRQYKEAPDPLQFELDDFP